MQGRVKPVGGVSAKIAAAHQAGLHRVFIPDENAADTVQLEGVELVRLTDVRQALEQMLLPITATEGIEEKDAVRIAQG